MPDSDWWTALWPDPDRVVADCGLAVGMSAIDLCAGDGWFTVPMARRAAKVLAVDLDAALLEVARRRLKAAGQSNAQCVAGDAHEVAALAGAPADFVFLANVFHGAPDKARLASAVHAALKPGGRFAIVGWHARPREETIVLGQPRGPATDLRMTPEATAAAVEPAGFAWETVVEVSPWHYGAVFVRR